MITSNLQRLLAREMERQGLSMHALSLKAGLNSSAVHSILAGRSRHPRSDTLEAIGKALGYRWPDFAEMISPSADDPDASSDRSPPLPSQENSEAEPKTRSRTRRIVEYDVRLSAGFGAVATEEAAVDEWAVPRTWLPRLQGRPEECVVVEVVGDSMAPEFQSGDKVLIDTADRRPTPPGYFAIWDGLGTILKQVEHIPHSDPPTLRIKSRNPEYDTYERDAAEVHIAGRVIGLMRRL